MPHYGYTRAVQAGKEMAMARQSAKLAEMEKDPVKRGEVYERAAGVAFRRAEHTLFSDPGSRYSVGVKWATEAAKAFDEAGLSERAAENRQKAEHYAKFAGGSGQGSQSLLEVSLRLDENLENIARDTKRS